MSSEGWKHDGHEVWMMVQEPRVPGSHLGPYCRDCDEAMFWMAVPYPEDLEKARAWVEKNRPDLLTQDAERQEGGVR